VIRQAARYFLTQVAPIVAVGLLVFWLIRAHVLERYIVPSRSMEPTLHGDPDDGDIVLVDQTAFWWRDPQLHDLVVVRAKGKESRSAQLVKRVVAVGDGDQVNYVKIAHGDVWVGRTPDQDWRRIEKDPFALRDLRQTHFSHPGHGPKAAGEYFVQDAELWRADADGIELAPGAASLDQLLAPQAASGPVRQPDPEARLPGFLNMQSAVTMSFLDCHGQLLGRDWLHPDIGIELDVGAQTSCTALCVTLERRGDYYTLACTRDGNCELLRNGQPTGQRLRGPAWGQDLLRIELGYLDGRIFGAYGEASFVRQLGPDPGGDEVAETRALPRRGERLHVGVAGGPARLRRLRVFHDVYYESREAPFGVGAVTTDLAPGALYLLGDNTAESRDSRSFGPVPRSEVIGRPWLVLAPLARLRVLPR
jgi:signal peptidase I